jgi:hypothetical protein
MSQDNTPIDGFRRSISARKALVDRTNAGLLKAEHARLLAQQSDDTTEDARIKRVMKQIQRCEELLESCKAADFPKLTAAKERLWNLIIPKAGVMRPRGNGTSTRCTESGICRAAHTNL